MFKNPEDLLQFLLRCRNAKIKAIKVGDIEVSFSELAFVDAVVAEEIGTEQRNTSKTLVDTLPAETTASEDDELLFWSTKA
jgi:hypothetical protein